MDYLSFKILIYALVLNIKAMYPARVKVRKKDISVLARKQQKCRGRARLNCHSKNFPIQDCKSTTFRLTRFGIISA